jgi:hypothetical protein
LELPLKDAGINRKEVEAVYVGNYAGYGEDEYKGSYNNRKY